MSLSNRNPTELTRMSGDVEEITNMVSNRLSSELQTLLETLEYIRRACGSNPEYQDPRGVFPLDWLL